MRGADAPKFHVRSGYSIQPSGAESHGYNSSTASAALWMGSGASTEVERRQTISGGHRIMSLNLRNTLLIVAATLVAQAPAVAADAPFVQSAKEVKWGAPPPVFPPGAKFAVIAGDPAATGLVTVRFDMPAGYTIPPHFHPTDEHITVLKGSFTIGMGDVIDKTRTRTLSPGGYAVAVANMHHYAYTTSGATIQVHLQGPFAITYVNAADDPSKKRP
jgi:quercetin dioxygenase-like cupin family protein